MLQQLISVGDGLRLKAFSSSVTPDQVTHAESIPSFIQFTAVQVPQGEYRAWTIEEDVEPITLWIFEANVANNKTVNWIIKNDLDQVIFNVTLTTSQFTQLGNTLYWNFPKATPIRKGYTAYLTANFQMDGVLVNCINCHLNIAIEGRYVLGI